MSRGKWYSKVLKYSQIWRLNFSGNVGKKEILIKNVSYFAMLFHTLPLVLGHWPVATDTGCGCPVYDLKKKPLVVRPGCQTANPGGPGDNSGSALSYRMNRPLSILYSTQSDLECAR